MICLYWVMSTNSNDSSDNNFRLVSWVWPWIYNPTYQIFSICILHTFPSLERFLLGSATLPSQGNSASIQYISSLILHLSYSYFLWYVSHFLSKIDHPHTTIVCQVHNLKVKVRINFTFGKVWLAKKLYILPYQALWTCFNPYRVFFNLHTWVTLFLTSNPCVYSM